MPKPNAPPSLPGVQHDSLSTLRTAEVWSLGRRDSADEWTMLHGYAQRATEVLSVFAPWIQGQRVLAPEALNRFYRRGGSGEVGASWMTCEHREAEIADLLAYLDSARANLGAIAPRRRHVLGFSQGAATALRWALRGTHLPDRVVLWCGDLPPDLGDDELLRLRELEFWWVHSPEDRMLPATKVQEGLERLARLSIPVKEFRSSAGHALDSGDVASLWKQWQSADAEADSTPGTNPQAPPLFPDAACTDHSARNKSAGNKQE